jgi:hypothetical protein
MGDVAGRIRQLLDNRRLVAAHAEGRRTPRRYRPKGQQDPGSVRWLWTAMNEEARRRGRRPWSYATTYAAVKKGRLPRDLDTFAADAAAVLGVNVAWLAAGTGPKTVYAGEMLAAMDQMEQKGLAVLHDPADVATLAALDLGSPDVTSRRRAAVLRFADRLDDVDAPGANPDRRAQLVRAAARILIDAETSWERTYAEADALTPGPKVRPAWTEPPSIVTGLASGLLVDPWHDPGRYVLWADRILDAFADRVIGLGERGHAPTATRKRGASNEATETE